MYINNTIPYQRRSDLEKIDSGIVIVDLNLTKPYRIICLYRFFNISNYKVGRNLMVLRFKILSNKIDYSWLNASYETFKIKCKSLLL